MTAAIDPALERALATVVDPEIRRPLVELDMIPAATLEDGVARIQLELTVAACPAAPPTEPGRRSVLTSTWNPLHTPSTGLPASMKARKASRR